MATISFENARRESRLILVIIASLLAMMLCAANNIARAGEADVIAAEAMKTSDNTWTFVVTVKCNDRDSGYFCDRIEVMDPDGRLLGVRELLNPHIDEQPFTSELSGVRVFEGFVHGVLIRAHHTVRGYDGKSVKLQLQSP